MTQIIHDRPPNIDAIVAIIGPAALNLGVIFAYKDAVYNPSGIKLPPSLIAHEEVHLRRQALCVGGADEWWQTYLTDPGFRYYEELLAHKAELASLFSMAPGGRLARNQRRQLIAMVAKRLSSKLYRYPVTFDKAKHDLLAA